MKTIVSMGATLAIALLFTAGDLSARDGERSDKGGDGSKGGNRSSGKTEQGGSGKRHDSGPQNQFKKGGDNKYSDGFKKLNPEDMLPKSKFENPKPPSSKKTKQYDLERDRDARPKKEFDDRVGKGKHDDRDWNKDHHKSDWKAWTKDGWSKDNWNQKYNAQHRSRHHGYWYGGIWYPPLVIVQRQPVVYLQPRQPVLVGQKWLGVTYDPYDGGGAYVTGIYKGSPAEQLGLEVGDVIVTIDGRDATDLPSAIRASDGDITMQVLRGRTGELAEAQVNIIR